jgi:putative spermidine/putrescine transport system ATP-binding protein
LSTQARERVSEAPPATAVAPDVRLVGLRKTYGDVVAVDRADFEIAQGEFFTMLGPSGSGKTTTLRLIAGFERPDEGRIELAGVDVTRRPPYTRDVNTVFQDYALFPHMSVAENVGYGLRVRRVLGALDLKLRQEMQLFLKSLQTDLEITFLYVTHDQEEALTMSDRIAVFNAGRVEQIGTPADVYERPGTEFVAGFIGVSNVLERGGRKFTVRPEKIQMLEDGQGGETGRIREVVYVGMFTRFVVELDSGGELSVVKQNLETSSQEALESKGRRVRLEWRPEHTFEIEPGGEG